MRTALSPLAVAALVLALAANALWIDAPRAAQNSTTNIQAEEAEAAARATQETVDEAVAEVNDAKAAAYFARHCTAPCHDTRTTCMALGKRGKNWWDITLAKMQFKGVPMDAAQKEMLLDWLWDLRAGSSPPCE